jgi:tetratricopeptide (TPR) repeat protein
MSSFLKLLMAAVCGAALLGCGKDPGIPIIGSGSEYTDHLANAESLTKDILERYERGEALSDADRNKLREAQKLFMALIAFRPEGFGPYFGLAKIHEALGEKDEALFYMQKFIQYAPPNPIPEVKQLLGEAHFVSGTIYESYGEFASADLAAQAAVKYNERNPDYLSLLASSKLRRKDVAGAKSLVEKALQADPNHGRARQLEAMIGQGS